jgi:hypothetical protein
MKLVWKLIFAGKWERSLYDANMKYMMVVSLFWERNQVYLVNGKEAFMPPLSLDCFDA